MIYPREPGRPLRVTCFCPQAYNPIVNEPSQQNMVISCIFIKEQWNTFSFRGICSYNKNSSQRKTVCFMAVVITSLCTDQFHEADSKIWEQATIKEITLIISPSLCLSFLASSLLSPFFPSLFPASLPPSLHSSLEYARHALCYHWATSPPWPLLLPLLHKHIAV